MSVAFAIEPTTTNVNEIFCSIVELCLEKNLGMSHYAFEFLHDLKDQFDGNNEEVDRLFNLAYYKLQDLLMANDEEQIILRNQFLALADEIQHNCC